MTLHTPVRQGRLVVEMPPEVDISNAEALGQEPPELCRGLTPGRVTGLPRWSWTGLLLRS
jgi:hypothetical protein